MLPVFLKSYVEAAKPDHAFVKKVMVQYGVHIIFWPVSCPGWDSEEAKMSVLDGIEVLRRVVDEDWAWLKQSPLKEIIPEAWEC